MFQKADHTKSEEEFLSNIKTHEHDVRELTLQNQELDMDIEDNEDKINEW